MLYGFRPLICLMVLGTGPLAAGEGYPRSELLLEPRDLARSEVAEQFVILDARPQDEYGAGHVPGAVRVDHDEWKQAFQEGQDAAGWSARIGRVGIGDEARVVIYDDNALKDAARIWWILRYWGVQDARLLNGGWKGWTSGNLPTTQDSSTDLEPVPFQARPQAGRLTTGSKLLGLLDGNVQIVDTRSEDEFCGVDKRAARGGAIPGAKHLEWSDLIDAETGRLKPADKLRELFEKAGINLQQPAVTHCQSGGRASVMAFGLELMGAEQVSNYYRGWSEWGDSKETPIVVPERKD
jgi:thiosulfate/3-mercaptopyruvate sulfurtransferase